MHCGMTVVILMVVTAVPPRPHATASPRSANSVAGAAASSTTLARSSCPASALWENGPLFGEFSLCLSRACLGKMFVFIHIIDDNGSKRPFSYLSLRSNRSKAPIGTADHRGLHRNSAGKTPFCPTFPTCVPSLSW
jgi:hypothetical protein